MHSVLIIFILLQPILCQNVTTVAGGSTYGYLDGQGVNALFDSPNGMTIDSLGNIYVTDYNNNRIRKINGTGYVSTFAGSTQGFLDGQGTSAKFYIAVDITIDSLGNFYVADYKNYRIRKINATGYVTTVAGSGSAGYLDGQGTSAKFYDVEGVTIDSNGNIYVGDGSSGNKIRKINATGYVSTVAGSSQGYSDGQGTSAKFDLPSGVHVDSYGNIYVADFNNNRIRKINSTGYVSTVAGSSPGNADGQGISAQLNAPIALTQDLLGNLYVADSVNHRIRKITIAGHVTTVAGSSSGYADGIGTNAKFSYPQGVAFDSLGNLYVGDSGNDRVRKITFPLTTASTTTTSIALAPSTSSTSTTLSHSSSSTTSTISSASSTSSTLSPSTTSTTSSTSTTSTTSLTSTTSTTSSTSSTLSPSTTSTTPSTSTTSTTSSTSTTSTTSSTSSTLSPSTTSTTSSTSTTSTTSSTSTTSTTSSTSTTSTTSSTSSTLSPSTTSTTSSTSTTSTTSSTSTASSSSTTSTTASTSSASSPSTTSTSTSCLTTSSTSSTTSTVSSALKTTSTISSALRATSTISSALRTTSTVSSALRTTSTVSSALRTTSTISGISSSTSNILTSSSTSSSPEAASTLITSSSSISTESSKTSSNLMNPIPSNSPTTSNDFYSATLSPRASITSLGTLIHANQAQNESIPIYMTAEFSYSAFVGFVAITGLMIHINTRQQIVRVRPRRRLFYTPPSQQRLN